MCPSEALNYAAKVWNERNKQEIEQLHARRFSVPAIKLWKQMKCAHHYL